VVEDDDKGTYNKQLIMMEVITKVTAMMSTLCTYQSFAPPTPMQAKRNKSVVSMFPHPQGKIIGLIYSLVH